VDTYTAVQQPAVCISTLHKQQGLAQASPEVPGALAADADRGMAARMRELCTMQATPAAGRLVDQPASCSTTIVGYLLHASGVLCWKVVHPMYRTAQWRKPIIEMVCI
jgi:hypothetical protein